MPGRIVAAILVLSICAFAPPAYAARFSGEYLLHVCASDVNGKELVPGGHIACQGYIGGVLDYHNIIHAMGTAPTVDFCVPEATDMNTLQKIVVKYLQANRQQHAKFVAAPAVAMALYMTYPCKKK
jgi:hypothetical protein